MMNLRALVIVAALTGSVLFAGGSAGLAAAPPQPSTRAPGFTLPLANGKGKITLRAFKGHAVYLNFFASWCGPCNDEAPALKKIAQQYRAKGLVFIGIDELESAKKALQFARKYALPYQIALDDDGTAGASYGVVGLPVQVLIGADGKVIFDEPGPINPAALRRVLNRVLAKR